MQASHEKIKRENQVGHNSGHVNEQIKELAARYAKADEESGKLNDERAKIREEIEGLGLDTKAWQDEIGRAKRDLKKKDGYDESVAVIRGALGQMNMEDLFAHVARKEREKEEARAAKAKEKEAKKKEPKETKPKKSIGEQQADAIMATH